MSKVVLPPLPPIREWPHSHEELRARDLEVARVVLEAAADFCYDQRANWSIESVGQVAAETCGDGLRALKFYHE